MFVFFLFGLPQYTAMIYFLVMILAPLGFIYAFLFNDQTKGDVIINAPKKFSQSPTGGWYGYGCFVGVGEGIEAKDRCDKSYINIGNAAGVRHSWSMQFHDRMMGHFCTGSLGFPMARPAQGQFVYQ